MLHYHSIKSGGALSKWRYACFRGARDKSLATKASKKYLGMSLARAWNQWIEYISEVLIANACKFHVLRCWLRGLEHFQMNMEATVADELCTKPSQMKWKDTLGRCWRLKVAILHWNSRYRARAWKRWTSCLDASCQ